MNAQQDTPSERALVDYERGRLMSDWKPRRLGGGLGGKKESGQLRFGGRDRPFIQARNDTPSRLCTNRSDDWWYERTEQRSRSRSTTKDTPQRQHTSESYGRRDRDSYYAGHSGRDQDTRRSHHVSNRSPSRR